MTEFTKALSFAKLHVRVERIGKDVLVTVSGGEAHIGSCVVAVPRPSLAAHGKPGCTSSVINLTGHKDEVICRRIAEELCRASGRTVVCTGGFHADGISGSGIREVTEAAEEIIKEIECSESWPE